MGNECTSNRFASMTKGPAPAGGEDGKAIKPVMHHAGGAPTPAPPYAARRYKCDDSSVAKPQVLVISQKGRSDPQKSANSV